MTLFDPDERPQLAEWAVPLPDPTRNTGGQHHRQAGDTEREAARLVAPRTGTQRAAVLAALMERPMTDAEVAEATGLYLYSAAPRRVELVQQGWVEDSGERVQSPRGVPAIVWRVTEAGRA